MADMEAGLALAVQFYRGWHYRGGAAYYHYYNHYSGGPFWRHQAFVSAEKTTETETDTVDIS